MNKPLHGKRILVTRAADDNTRWSEALRAAGAEPVQLECIRVELFDVAKTLQRAIDRADWIVLGSRRAAWALENLNVRPNETHIACVGHATQAALSDEHRAISRKSEGGTMQSLCEELQQLLKNAAPQNIVEVAPVNGLHMLPDHFAESQHEIARIFAYATQPVHAKGDLPALEELTNGPVDAAFFASPSAILGLTRSAILPKTLACVAIGPTTQAALTEAGFPPVAKSESRDIAGMIAATAAHFQSQLS